MEREIRARKIAVLIEDNYQTLEAWYPYLRFKEEGIQTVFFGNRKKRIQKQRGLSGPTRVGGPECGVRGF